MQVLQDWLLTPRRAAIHRPTATAVIADLHLGYDAVRRRSGEAVPAFDPEESLADLRRLAQQHNLRRLVVAGDLFEDGRHPAASDDFLKCLREARLELVGVVPGNHDRHFPQSKGLPICTDGISLGSWRVVHGDDPGEPPGLSRRDRIVQGHLHPCFRWQGLSAPCFLVGEQHLVLPAFSADAAGVNVARDSAWRGYRRCVIVGDRVLDFSTAQKPSPRLARASRESGARRRSRSGRSSHQ